MHNYNLAASQIDTILYYFHKTKQQQNVLKMT